ncbi:sigma 54 modulation/S30EA-like ribosomal protein [Nocardia puris]|uniref:Sigma 54 modulation/S30EA-like ribosomal protein n=1 Tax=Nocardia puris TaxID=208602 RepID=A0A366DU88_9NOCA|nr:sigma 54 modulation/S30EA-like ribosomal protein [Nocardia puris]
MCAVVAEISELWVPETGFAPEHAEAAATAVSEVLRAHGISSGFRLRTRRVPGGAVAQAGFELRGRPARVQVADAPADVVDRLVRRVDRHLTVLAVRGTRPWPDPDRVPIGYGTAPRPVVRHKRFRLAVCSVLEAVAVLDAMDYEAHLFTDATTGSDAVVYRGGPFGVRLARQCCGGLPCRTGRLALTVDARHTRRFDEREAAAHLCRYGLPFLFHTDPRTGRGQLLYRRHDGDLAVVSPADTPKGEQWHAI